MGLKFKNQCVDIVVDVLGEVRKIFLNVDIVVNVLMKLKMKKPFECECCWLWKSWKKGKERKTFSVYAAVNNSMKLTLGNL